VCVCGVDWGTNPGPTHCSTPPALFRVSFFFFFLR
jgi:hypothetical protein